MLYGLISLRITGKSINPNQVRQVSTSQLSLQLNVYAYCTTLHNQFSTLRTMFLSARLSKGFVNKKVYNLPLLDQYYLRSTMPL